MLADCESWPQWWRGVEAVDELDAGDERRVGSAYRVTWRAPVVPYRVRFDFHVDAVDEPRSMARPRPRRAGGRRAVAAVRGRRRVRGDVRLGGAHHARVDERAGAAGAAACSRDSHDRLMRRGGRDLARRHGGAAAGRGLGLRRARAGRRPRAWPASPGCARRPWPRTAPGRPAHQGVGVHGVAGVGGHAQAGGDRRRPPARGPAPAPPRGPSRPPPGHPRGRCPAAASGTPRRRSARRSRWSRSVLRMTSPTAARASSPAPWPKRSLICLKWSRSSRIARDRRQRAAGRGHHALEVVPARRASWAGPVSASVEARVSAMARLRRLASTGAAWAMESRHALALARRERRRGLDQHRADDLAADQRRHARDLGGRLAAHLAGQQRRRPRPARRARARRTARQLSGVASTSSAASGESSSTGVAATSRSSELLRTSTVARGAVDLALEVVLDQRVGLVLVAHDLDRLGELGLGLRGRRARARGGPGAPGLALDDHVAQPAEQDRQQRGSPRPRPCPRGRARAALGRQVAPGTRRSARGSGRTRACELTASRMSKRWSGRARSSRISSSASRCQRRAAAACAPASRRRLVVAGQPRARRAARSNARVPRANGPEEGVLAGQREPAQPGLLVQHRGEHLLAPPGLVEHAVGRAALLRRRPPRPRRR